MHRGLSVVLLSAVVTGCAAMGPRALRANQVDYARAVGEATNREILSMIVGLRYADAPAFLNLTQIIAAYTFDAASGAQVNVGPNPSGGPPVAATGSLSYANHPTFTFTPISGEAYARAYIQPLPPALILPLIDSGIPVDLLLRITVQSIGDLDNATMLGGPSGGGSPQFFRLLRVLRRLQLSGALSVQYQAHGNTGQVSLLIGAPSGGASAAVSADAARARALLHLSSPAGHYPIVSADTSTPADTIPVATRSVLAILSDVSAQISVPRADVRLGATKPSVPLVGGETRPVIVVHAGKRVPATAYLSVTYRGTHLLIDDSDFDSKDALSVVQNVMALATITDFSRAPLVTVPAG
ncbi:MAG: hypothetical protein ACRETB_07190 [Steroidobacteraceae bacterium]